MVKEMLRRFFSIEFVNRGQEYELLLMGFNTTEKDVNETIKKLEEDGWKLFERSTDDQVVALEFRRKGW